MLIDLIAGVVLANVPVENLEINNINPELKNYEESIQIRSNYYSGLDLRDQIQYLRKNTLLKVGPIKSGCYSVSVAFENSGPDDILQGLTFIVPYETSQGLCSDYIEKLGVGMGSTLSVDGLIIKQEVNGAEVIVAFPNTSSTDYQFRYLDQTVWIDYPFSELALGNMMLAVGAKEIAYTVQGRYSVLIEEMK